MTVPAVKVTYFSRRWWHKDTPMFVLVVAEQVPERTVVLLRMKVMEVALILAVQPLFHKTLMNRRSPHGNYEKYALNVRLLVRMGCQGFMCGWR